MLIKGLLRKRFYLGLALSIITSMIILHFAEAASKPEPALQPQYGGTLRIIRMAGPGTPFGTPWETVGLDISAATPSLENLMRQHVDGHFEPWLATALKVAPDMKSITLTLRKGVKFQDGTDFNAEAAKFNLDAFKGAKRSGTEAWTSVQVVDEYSIRINISKYTNTMVGDLVGLRIASPTAFKTKGIEWARWNPVGTGPFQFVSFERDVSTKYKKFNDYWQKGKPYLDGVEFLYIKDPLTQSAAMQAGEADIQSVVLGKVTADMQALGFEIINRPTAALLLIPDSANPDSPLADKRVRQAVAYALDREAIAKALGYGFLGAAYQIAPPGSMAYVSDLEGHRFNPEKAKQLLADAGYPKGFKTKIIPMSGTPKEFMVAVQGYLGKIGIVVDLDFVDMGKYMDYRRKGWSNGFLCQPFLAYTNFGRTLELYLPSTSPELVSLKRPTGFDDLINEAVTSREPDMPKLKNAVRKIYDEATVIPIYFTGAGWAHAKKVHESGFLSLEGSQDWTPEKAWMSK